MSHPLKRYALSALCAAMLSACAIGPDYQRPSLDLPQQWPNALAPAENTQAVSAEWWKSFADPVLDQLVERALQHNRDLVKANARVEEAAALWGSARADLLPRLDAGGQFQRARVSSVGTTSGIPRGATVIGESQSGNLALSYQLDLWGKFRRANEAARADLAATAFARDTTQLSVAAQVARAYFAVRSLDAQLQTTRDTLQSREKGLQIQQKRLNGGLISELDFRRYEAETATARATLPQIEQALVQAEGALQVLIGASPRDIVESQPPRGMALEALKTPPAIPSGLPSSLLTRRPDIRASEAQLIAQNARIGVARAAYLPDIGLTGNLGSESLELADLFTAPARAWSFVARLSMPIFDFGKTGAAVDAATARQKQALAEYEKTIQTAFAETRLALVSVDKTRERHTAQNTQTQSLKRALHLAQLRYENGYSSYLDVLDAQRSLFAAELETARAREAQLDAVVNLNLALGGGWKAPSEQ